MIFCHFVFAPYYEQKAMRDSNVKELPAPGSFDCDALTKFVAREFSIARYSMKKTVRLCFLLRIS
jgi:hypothetical protein